MVRIMSEMEILNYEIKDPLELNLSYMPFINEGGLFIPTPKLFSLGDAITVDLKLPEKKESMRIVGKVVWITPKNALHHVLPGVGIQFGGKNAAAIRAEIEAHLDSSVEVGGYTYGIMEEAAKSERK